jgi:hypothetical protein
VRFFPEAWTREKVDFVFANECLPTRPDTASGERTNDKISNGLIPRERRGYDYRVNEY